MNYTVVWLTDAENELASLWLNSSKREAVTVAAAELDRRLAENGESEGESRHHHYRITFEAPLAVVFRVDEINKAVFVGQVWEFQ